jgi:hypothetical protein
MHGSILQRSIGSYELRVFTGTDPASGKRSYRSKTVRGNRAEAERELATMVEIVGRGPSLASRTTVGETARTMVHSRLGELVTNHDSPDSLGAQ